MSDPGEPPSELERSHFTAGQVQGLMLFAAAIAKLHPERGAVLTELAKGKQIAFGVLEQQPVPEAYLDGLNDATDRLAYALKHPEKF